MDVRGSHTLAAVLSANAREAWQHYTTMQAHESAATAILASQAERKQRECRRSPSPGQGGVENGVDGVSSESSSSHAKRAAILVSRAFAEALVSELKVQQLSTEASKREALYVEAVQGMSTVSGPEPTQPVATSPSAEPAEIPPALNPQDDTGLVKSYLAESLTRELHAQQLSVAAREQETRYMEATQRKEDRSEMEFEEPAPLAQTRAESPEPIMKHMYSTSADLEAKSVGVYLAESLVSELRMQQLTVQLCQFEAKYVKAVLSRNTPDRADELSPDTVTSIISPLTVLSTSDQNPLDRKEPGGISNLTDTVNRELQDAFSQTEPGLIPTVEVATNTPTLDIRAAATNTESLQLQDFGVNTVLSFSKLMKNAQATEKYKKLHAEHKATIKELRQEKSQRMTAEQLVKIVQTDLTSVQQRNITETTARLRLESELTDVKAELGYAQKQIEDKDQRISELEESLTGTSLLVRKLEEQNAVSLMNRGGIDYMVQAKLAEGRANEAEQKLRVLQVDLLQSQNEVKQLLERVAGAAREKSEMVSSKVHIQLLQIADDRALAAEQKAQELEKEVQDLKRKLSAYEAEKPTADSKDAFSSLSLSSSFPFSPYSGYSVPSYPSALSSSWETKPLTINGSTSSFGSSYPGSVGLGSTGSMFPSSLTGAVPKPHQPRNTAGPDNLLSSENKQAVSSSDSLWPRTADAGAGSSFDSSGVGGALHTGTLFPSSLKPLALSTDTPKLNETDVKGSFPASTGPPTKTSTEGPFGVELPSYEANRAPQPTPMPTSAPRLKSQSDGDSSDWSSSDEDPDRETPNPFVPSTHASLTAQWEWRTRHDSGAADGTTTTTPVKPAGPVAHTPTGKRRPPPIAPKPNLNKPLEHQASHAIGKIFIAQELPSSFEEPTRNSGLRPLATGFRRPHGPGGRNLPSRYRKQRGLYF